MGERIEFRAHEEACSGYLARPSGEAQNKAVIVIHEWWGLVPHIEEVCERFAKVGYVALAPELYPRGQSTVSPDEAERLMMALDVARVESVLRAAIVALKAESGAEKVGVIGFCLGGKLALYAATTSASQISACVNFYGVHPRIEPNYQNLACPVLALFAQNDDFVPPRVASEMVDKIREAGGVVEAHTYDGGHAFFNDSRPEAYNQSAAAAAWQRTLQFLGEHL